MSNIPLKTEANHRLYKFEIKISKAINIDKFYYIIKNNEEVVKWLKIMKCKL